MNNLKEELVPIMERIKKFRPFYEQSEMAVREQIVTPILRCLGWNPENPEEVQPNVSTEEGVPDYSLIKNGEKILFVEVKNLNVDIKEKDIISQLMKYSSSVGKEYGVLTNGALWLLIKTFEKDTTYVERIVLEIDLENEELPAVLRKIATISKTNIGQIEKLVKKVQILDEIWQSLLDEPEEMIKGLMPVVKSLISQGYPDYRFEDTEIEDLLKERVKEMISNPSEEETRIIPSVEPIIGLNSRKMKLKGESFKFRNNYEIVVNTANWLIKTGKLKPSDSPVRIGRGKRNLINKESKHQTGSDFRAPKKLSNGLWIEAHGSTADHINHAKRLLEKFGVPADVLIFE